MKEGRVSKMFEARNVKLTETLIFDHVLLVDE